MADFGNPLALIAWAIAQGRADAADYDLWVTRLTGDGKQYWVDWLLDGNSSSADRTFPA